MARCINGKVLHVDLTDGRIWVEEPPDSFFRLYGGGSAMGVHYLLKEMPAGADPLGPDNILTLFTGLPTGLAVSGQSRLCISARSPISGGVGDSQCGGFFPAVFKSTGFDGAVIRGQADHPVYLYLHDGIAEIRDAAHLWGLQTADAEKAIQAELNDTKLEVLQIGPAGEKQVRFAAIMNMRNRANGRTGMGAVMGSKRLKAVVVKGGRRLEPHQKAAITDMQRSGTQNIDQIPDVKGLGLNGTADVVAFQNAIGSFPTRNYTEGQFEGFESLCGDRMTDTILKSRDTCFSCTVRCKRVVESEYEGREIIPAYGGPEYETIGTMGSYCGVSDLQAIALANQICNANGMDTIATGATVAFAMECFEHGLITLEDTGGIDLRFGNASAMVAMVEAIARREGFGDILAEGSYRAAERIGKGAQRLAVTVKKTELPAHIPHAKKSLGLIYAVNPFGADHQSSEHDPMIEEGGADLYFERLAQIGLQGALPPGSMGEEKIRFAYLGEVFYSALDSYCLCQFVWGPAWQLYGPQDMAAMLSVATGWDITVDEILRVGERRIQLMRAFNAREGFSRADDVLPERFEEPFVGTGPTAGVAYPAADLEQFKDVYYRLAGLDLASGRPTRDRLNALNLEWVSI